ncbi:MAG: VOC family protein [Pseudomonadota bacterium]
MTSARLEHINITVPDAYKKAAMLSDLFGWHIRWQGEVMDGAGKSIHVGSEDDYIALYSPNAGVREKEPTSYTATGGALNHIALVVDDLDLVEAKVKKAGYRPKNAANYEPGRRFYFFDEDGIEFEVVSYTS